MNLLWFKVYGYCQSPLTTGILCEDVIAADVPSALDAFSQILAPDVVILETQVTQVGTHPQFVSFYGGAA